MAGGTCPKWLAVLSNRVLPPFFFFAMTLLLFYSSNHFDGAITFELNLAGLFSGVMGVATSIT